jgi:guanylate kinase
VHYRFVTPETFASLVDADGFLEHAQFGGNRYGTPKSVVEEARAAGKVVVLDIEMEGVKQVKRTGVDARYVFIKPPSVEVLEQRLRGRGTEKEESIQKRLRQAVLELEYSQTEGVHDLIIENDDLERAYKELEEFVYKPKEA